eukprot:SAG11_NODE_2790_length_2969_cov_1.817073_4_plen_113_part_00
MSQRRCSAWKSYTAVCFLRGRAHTRLALGVTASPSPGDVDRVSRARGAREGRLGARWIEVFDATTLPSLEWLLRVPTAPAVAICCSGHLLAAHRRHRHGVGEELSPTRGTAA